MPFTPEQIAEEMYKMVEEASGKRQLSPNDLNKAVMAKLGPEATKDACKKAIRILTETGRCVYYFAGGVNYLQLPHKEGAAN